MRKAGYVLIIAVASTLLCWQCGSGPTASGGTGTETGNAFSGRILYQDSTPAAGVTIRIFPVDFMPLTTSGGVEKTTDSNGYYYYGDLGEGRYNVEGLKESLGVFIDSIVVDRDSSLCRVPGGFMGRLGVIKGATAVPGFDNPNRLRLMVYFPGTGRIQKPVIGEGFVFDSLPPGPYRMVYDPTLLDSYLQQEFDVNLAAGDTLVLDTVILAQRQP